MNRPYLIQLDKIADERGLFYVLWKGVPDITIKQSQVSVSKPGVIRGIHAEPWDKFIHVIEGHAFAAIVNMDTLEVCTFNLDNKVALFVPQGWGNSFQALDDVTYLYLCTDVWKPGEYPSLKYNDPRLNIMWRNIPVITSAKDA